MYQLSIIYLSSIYHLPIFWPIHLFYLSFIYLSLTYLSCLSITYIIYHLSIYLSSIFVAFISAQQTLPQVLGNSASWPHIHLRVQHWSVILTLFLQTGLVPRGLGLLKNTESWGPANQHLSRGCAKIDSVWYGQWSLSWEQPVSSPAWKRFSLWSSCGQAVLWHS